MNQRMKNVIENIDELISKNGFVYALCMATIDDTTIDKNVIEERNSSNRLNTNELSFLWGRLINLNNIWDYPSDMDALYSLKVEIYKLMDELHTSFYSEISKESRYRLANNMPVGNIMYEDRFLGDFYKENAFYSGGDLYDEEYLYFARERYNADVDWLKANKHYYIKEFCDTTNKIKQIINIKIHELNLVGIPENLGQVIDKKPESMTDDDFYKTIDICQFFKKDEQGMTVIQFCERLKDILSFNKSDLVGCANTEFYLNNFSLAPSLNCNSDFTEPGSYNILLAKPILKLAADNYIVTNIHQLFKTVHDMPNVWLTEESKTHKSIASHKGKYGEHKAYDILNNIFEGNTYRNIIVKYGKKTITDVDLLCIWKNLAICFQIKSKGLTLKAQYGDVSALKSDFKHAFQDAYDQGAKCRNALLNPCEYTFETKEGDTALKNVKLKDVYIVCVTTDEYKGLTEHMNNLLIKEDSSLNAIAMNIYDLAILSLFLNKPYYFMHYIYNRIINYSKQKSDIEISFLSSYMSNRLYIAPEYNFEMLDNSLALTIDSILLPLFSNDAPIKVDNSIWRNLDFDELIDELNEINDDNIVDFIFSLLCFNKKGEDLLMEKLHELMDKRKNDGLSYRGFPIPNFGFTFCCMPSYNMNDVIKGLAFTSLEKKKKFGFKKWIGLGHINGSHRYFDFLQFYLGNNID